MWKVISATVITTALLTGCAVQIPLNATSPDGTSPSQTHVKQVIEQKTADQLGPQWVPVALRIAWVESHWNANAVGPRVRGGEHALGVFQVLPSSARALGYNPHMLHNTDYSVDVGLAHMKSCLAAGVGATSDPARSMALCHVAGIGGWQQKLRKRSEIYKIQYADAVVYGKPVIYRHYYKYRHRKYRKHHKVRRYHIANK